eukprot:TRINITY_DN21692_c0_g1_i1.p1 TRINITY_DN21692_c0_g1~~TRINITY_DN21692_c0_g1_i1.p1  ORF type:complete len:644 (+),score=92.47 TRINITY_DN21692_c0_g1_i1:240-1934(+)
MNVIQSIPSEKLKHDFGNTVVSASAGNMGQGVAYAAKQRGARCVVVVPEHAPKAKTCVIEELHGGEIIRVPFARWWEILQSSDASLEMKGAPHMFVHPVSDRRVVAGNSTIGAEIVEDLPDVDAVFAPWGGGGLCCGIGSYLKSAVAKEDTSAGQLSTKRRRVGTKIDLVSCEPATACPLHTSLKEGQMCTNFAEYKASFIDGCGGKSVLSEMWPLAQELVSDARAVPLEDVKEAIRILAEKNKVIAEGAGAIALAAVLFGPREKLDGYRQVACVVCGGCIDKDVLIGILGSPSVPKALADGPPIPKVFSAADVAKLLPMAACIDAAAEALRAVAAGEGVMPVRSVLKLPVDKVAFLGTMPCFMDGLAAVKAITVLPGNRGTAFSSHQGSVLLFNAKNHGELLAISDAHEITKIRTAAASAAATRAIFTRHAKAAPSTLAIVGAGQQAHSHCEAMLSLFNESIRDILVFGRNVSAIEACVEEIRRKYPSKLVSHFLMSEMSSHMPRADIICTVTSAGAAFLKLAHLKPTAHICAVGACQPQFAKLILKCCKLWIRFTAIPKRRV